MELRGGVSKQVRELESRSDPGLDRKEAELRTGRNLPVVLGNAEKELRGFKATTFVFLIVPKAARSLLQSCCRHQIC